MRVENVMHSGDALPRVHVTAKMPDVIYEMSAKGLGMTTVVDDGSRLAGVFTDGDLRRLMQKRKGESLELTVGECMTRTPVTIDRKSTRLNSSHANISYAVFCLKKKKKKTNKEKQNK